MGKCMPTKRTWFGREYHVHDWGNWEIVSQTKETRHVREVYRMNYNDYWYDRPVVEHILRQKRVCKECGFIEPFTIVND